MVSDGAPTGMRLQLTVLLVSSEDPPTNHRVQLDWKNPTMCLNVCLNIALTQAPCAQHLRPGQRAEHQMGALCVVGCDNARAARADRWNQPGQMG